jgi:hypothetical protein
MDAHGFLAIKNHRHFQIARDGRHGEGTATACEQNIEAALIDLGCACLAVLLHFPIVPQFSELPGQELVPSSALMLLERATVFSDEIVELEGTVWG